MPLIIGRDRWISVPGQPGLLERLIPLKENPHSFEYVNSVKENPNSFEYVNSVKEHQRSFKQIISQVCFSNCIALHFCLSFQVFEMLTFSYRAGDQTWGLVCAR